jgi:hypothetical protein
VLGLGPIEVIVDIVPEIIPDEEEAVSDELLADGQ